MNNKILFGIITATILMLSPFLIIQDVEAGWKSEMKKNLKKMEKSNEKMEDMADCAEKNLEKTLFYSKQGKIYIPSPDCDPATQYKYDRLNQMSGIDEYKDAHNFLLSNENYFQVNNEDDEDDDDKNDKKDKKKKNRD